MSNAYTAPAFKPAAIVEATSQLMVTLFKATPLYIFASALKSALQAQR